MPISIVGLIVGAIGTFTDAVEKIRIAIHRPGETPIEVLGIVHESKPPGMYFNFASAELTKRLGNDGWHRHTWTDHRPTPAAPNPRMRLGFMVSIPCAGSLIPVVGRQSELSGDQTHPKSHG